MRRQILPLLTLALALATAGADAGRAHARTLSAAAQAETAAASTAKVERLLKESGYTHKKVSEDIWLVNRQGKNFPEFQIIITAGQGFWLAGVVVAEKKRLRVTPELLSKLLRLNHSIDYVKVGIDGDEDLFVRREAGTRLLDLREFKDIVEQVASATDTVYAEVKPFLDAQ
jgi:hypothetical protein